MDKPYPFRRFELIDHTRGSVAHYPDQPRTLIAKDVTVSLDIQDDGETLKIFLSKVSYGVSGSGAGVSSDRPTENGGPSPTVHS
jgi:hypothetical protein